MENNFQKKPILLIDIDQNGKFILNKKGLEYIAQIQQNISVVTICGGYRTGKSFLLNRFAKVQKGFQLGNSTNPCTKGIWIWGQPLQTSSDQVILLLDTEGLNSYQRDENTDSKLFLLASLLSSTLIYNLMGSLDEKSLEQISFIASLTENFSNSLSYQDESDISKYFPNFVAIIRDFALDLKNLSAKEYLENCLRPLTGQGEEIQTKNQIRMAILNYFKQRDCYTLIRPVQDEQQLRNIDELSYDKLRPKFREDLENIISNIFKKLQLKMINSCPIQGSQYASLIIHYVERLNSGTLPQIESIYERVIKKEFTRLLEKTKSNFDLWCREEIYDQMPMMESEILEKINFLRSRGDDCLNQFKYSISMLKEAQLNFRKHVDEQLLVIKQENQTKSKNFCVTISQKLIDTLEKSIEKLDTNIIYLIKQIQQFKKIYMTECKGPACYEIFSNYFIDNAFHIIERFFNNSFLKYESDKGDLKRKISELETQAETFDLVMEQQKDKYESIVQRYQQEIDTLKQYYGTKQSEMKQLYEERFNDLDIVNKSMQIENKDLKEIKMLVSKQVSNQQVQKPTTQIKSSTDQYIQEQLQQINSYLKNFQKEIKDMVISNMEKQKELFNEEQYLKIEKKFQEQQLEMKLQKNEKIINIKETYKSQTEELQKQVRDLEKIKDDNLLLLIEKEGQIKILKEKIQYQEKEKKKSIEQAELLCSITEKLMKVLRKFDKD